MNKENTMTYEIVSERTVKDPETLKTPVDIYNLVKRYASKEKEYFIVITLDGAHKPISICIATIGLVNRTLVHPREVFNKAVRDMATAIVVCHNHPSGSRSPSDEDKDITVRLVDAGEVLGIPVIDHLIITKTGYYSFTQEGCMPKGREEI
jgi:DNA repair protein RadC